MLFKTRYTLETLDSLKTLTRDGRLHKITAFISNNVWIFFRPEPQCSLRTIAGLFSPLTQIFRVSRSQKNALIVLRHRI